MKLNKQKQSTFSSFTSFQGPARRRAFVKPTKIFSQNTGGAKEVFGFLAARRKPGGWKNPQFADHPPFDYARFLPQGFGNEHYTSDQLQPAQAKSGNCAPRFYSLFICRQWRPQGRIHARNRRLPALAFICVSLD
ncbi:hypothetical protein K3555_11075 [Leisingera sp. M527]|uniref:hypothetical protein n=1 Tax=unclassified Leisingera TaxID=2614906 RepID=UPI0021A25FCC|nr:MULTISPECIES: hypothetical protein [unclassified Leisingera]UWQ30848.1 hypothetical protein K3557_10070 [Leisingera sp. M523]UWQ31168.1 hypothetical protein K3555_11075 [Leisingera sp. M527]